MFNNCYWLIALYWKCLSAYCIHILKATFNNALCICLVCLRYLQLTSYTLVSLNNMIKKQHNKILKFKFVNIKILNHNS